MVDRQPAREPQQHGLARRQVAAVELQVDVPAEGVDPRGGGLEAFPAEHAAGQHHVADAAHADGVEPGELGLARARRDDDDGARFGPEGGHCFQRAAVVEGVAGRLDDDDPAQAERLLHLPVGVSRGMGRLEGSGRCECEAVLEDMHVAVAGAGGNERWDVHVGYSFRQRRASAALTAPAGSSPWSRAASWATVSIA